MKEWAADRINPESAKERKDRLAKKTLKVSKKVKLSAMVRFHDLTLEEVTK